MAKNITMFAGINTKNIRTTASLKYLQAHGHRSDMVYTTQQQLENSIIHTAEEMIKDEVDVVVDGGFYTKAERQEVLQKFKKAGYQTMIVTHPQHLGDLEFDEADSIMTLPVENI